MSRSADGFMTPSSVPHPRARADAKEGAPPPHAEPSRARGTSEGSAEALVALCFVACRLRQLRIAELPIRAIWTEHRNHIIDR